MMPDARDLRRDFLIAEHPIAPVVRLDASADAGIGPAAIAIGAFDGVHRAHAELIAAACADARKLGIASAVVTFDPDPDTVVAPRPAPKLMATADRIDALSHLGVDYVVVVPFTRELAALDHEAFFACLASVMDIKSIRVGSDFRLGRGGEANVEVIHAWGEGHGIEVHAHDLILEGGEPICSTRIRGRLAAGDVEGAAALLGRAPMVRGRVAQGRGEGTGMGFPTANIEVAPGLALPAEGVYEGLMLVDGSVWPAAVNVGLPPTFAERAASAHLEANLIGFEGDIYGREVALAFTRRLRPSRVFDSLDELIATVEGNIEDIRQNLGDTGVKIA